MGQRLCVADAAAGHRQHFEPSFADGLVADFAGPIGTLVDSGQGLVDELELGTECTSQDEVLADLTSNLATIREVVVVVHVDFAANGQLIDSTPQQRLFTLKNRSLFRMCLGHTCNLALRPIRRFPNPMIVTLVLGFASGS